jgi:hypothetical protein
MLYFFSYKAILEKCAAWPQHTHVLKLSPLLSEAFVSKPSDNSALAFTDVNNKEKFIPKGIEAVEADIV